ncbi:MAG: virulence RhuM family protein [Bacteroidia bacterium]|nr:virulence RhuM family protein [Bacteroidia bacterium]
MAKKQKPVKEGCTEILLYTTPNEKVKVEIYLQNETVWLTQQKIADLFGVQRPAVTKHLKNIFETGELEEEVVSSILEHTTQHGAIQGKTQETKVKYYNLDAIISVGYRVNSNQATAFRIWATERLKEYIIKGFTMDDERLKNPNNIFGKDYFEEQLARIRDIRSSERRFYQKITDIYSQCSADYNVNTQTTKDFFSTVQNKLHWAITGQTAAEIIAARVDGSKENMGLTTWKNAPKGAQKGVVMFMKDWVLKLDAFLQFNEEAVLKHPGKVSHEVALALAESEFEKYRIVQDKLIESDFDKELKKLK